jgi:hypothetical protein
MVLLLVFVFALLCYSTQGRKWNNTGKGSIIFEEAVSLPNLRPNAYVCLRNVKSLAPPSFSQGAKQ